MLARLAAVAVLGCILAYGLGVREGQQREQHRARAEAHEATLAVLQQEREHAETIDTMRKDHAVRYAEMEARFRAAAADIGPVWVRINAPAGGVPSAACAPAGNDGATGGGGLSAAPARDIGPDLLALTHDAHRVLEQLQVCREYGEVIQTFRRTNSRTRRAP